MQLEPCEGAERGSFPRNRGVAAWLKVTSVQLLLWSTRLLLLNKVCTNPWQRLDLQAGATYNRQGLTVLEGREGIFSCGAGQRAADLLCPRRARE